MSEFKKGDRVKIEFEGVIIGRGLSGNWVVELPDGEHRGIPDSYLTKLHEPLPTSSYAVIRIVENGDYPRVFELTGLAVWRETGNNSPFEAERIQALADEHGFTVLYAGDDE